MKKIATFIGLLVALAGSWALRTQAQSSSAAQTPSAGSVISSQNLDLAGYLGAGANAIAVQGNRAYVGLWHELAVLDMTNPLYPQLLGYSMLPQIQKVVVAGNFAYVITGDRQLHIIDVSNAAQPIDLGVLPNLDEVLDVEVAGDYAYLMTGYATATNFLRIFDISNPAQPIALGTNNTDYFAARIEVAGNYVYQADEWLGVRVVDVSDPHNPYKAGQSAPVPVFDVAVSNGYLYAASDGLRVMSLANPAQPVEVGHTAVSDPNDYYTRVWSAGQYVFAAHGQESVRIINVQTPTTPVVVGPLTAQPYIADLAVTGQLAYLAGGPAGVLAINFADVRHPQESGIYAPPFWGTRVMVSGTTAYLATANGLHAVDVSTPSLPSLLGNPAGPSAYEVAVKGNRAYTAGQGQGFHVIDVSDPAAMQVQGSYSTTVEVAGVAISGTYAYVTDGGNGLHVLQVSNPFNPVKVGGYSALNSWPVDVAISGTLAYLADSLSGLRVLDLRDPVHPQWVSTLGLRGAPVALAVSGRYVYVAEGSLGLTIVDIATPSAPQLIGMINVPDANGYASDVVVVDRFAYVAAGWDGVRMVDVSDPASPVEVGYSQPFAVEGVAVANGKIYATGYGGLGVLEYRARLTGSVVASNLQAIGSITLTLSSGQSVTTTLDGQYAFDDLPSGVYTITPNLPAFVFIPPGRTMTLPSAGTGGHSFVMLPKPVSATVLTGVTTTLTYTDVQGLPTDFVFASGMVTQTMRVTVTPTQAGWSSGDRSFAGHAFDLAADSVQNFHLPVTVTLRYSEVDLRVITDESALTLLWWNGSSWADAAATCVPASGYQHEVLNDMIELPICRTGRYALFGPTHQVYLTAVRQ